MSQDALGQLKTARARWPFPDDLDLTLYTDPEECIQTSTRYPGLKTARARWPFPDGA